MSNRTVYIVDDNTRVPRIHPLLAERLRLRRSSTWGDPREAIAALVHARQGARQACLMLDVRMPELSGLDVHDKPARVRRADCPVIYMSGHADVPLAVQAMQKGAVTLLEKPFDDEALEAALETAFASAPRRPGRATAAG